MIVTREEILASLTDEANICWHTNFHSSYATDRRYYVPRLEDVRAEVAKFMEQVGNLQLSYLLDVYDCNAYAFLLKGFIIFQAWKDGVERPPWPFAFVMGSEPPHAFCMCFVRVEDDKVWQIFEPQTGENWASGGEEYRRIFMTLF